MMRGMMKNAWSRQAPRPCSVDSGGGGGFHGGEFFGEFFVEHAGDEREALFDFFDSLVGFLRFAHFDVGEAEPDPGGGVARVDRNGLLVGVYGFVVLRSEERRVGKEC